MEGGLFDKQNRTWALGNPVGTRSILPAVSESRKTTSIRRLSIDSIHDVEEL